MFAKQNRKKLDRLIKHQSPEAAYDEEVQNQSDLQYGVGETEPRVEESDEFIFEVIAQ